MATTTTQENIKIEPNKLGVAPVGSLLREYALPSILATATTSLYNIIDTIFIGHYVGELGIAATTVALPIMIVLGAFNMWVGVGGNAIAAIKLGEGKPKLADKFLSNSLSLVVVLSILVSALAFIFLKPLLFVCGATTESYPYSYNFVLMIVLGNIIAAPGMALNNFIRTDGKPRIALYTVLAGAISNVVLNIVFVAHLGFGVRGSALATALSQGLTSVLVLIYFLHSKTGLNLTRDGLRLKLDLVLTILRLGIASFVLQIAAALVSLVLNSQIVRYGRLDPIGVDGGLATIGTMNKIVQFCLMPIIGMAIAMQPIIGFNYGAKNYYRVFDTWTTTAKISVAFTTVIWILALIMPEPIIRLFGLPEQYMELSKTVLRTFMLFMPIIPIQVLGSNYFQSTGQPLKSGFLSLTRQFIFLIPFFYLMPIILPKITPLTPLQSIVAALPGSDIAAVLLVLVFLSKEFKKLKAAADASGCDSQEDEIERMYRREAEAMRLKEKHADGI